MGESPGRGRGQPCPVPQAAGVIGLHAQRLLAHHEVLGAFEEDEPPELLEVERRVRVPREAQGAAFAGKSRLQLGARIAPASATCGNGEGLDQRGPRQEELREMWTDPATGPALWSVSDIHPTPPVPLVTRQEPLQGCPSTRLGGN